MRHRRLHLTQAIIISTAILHNISIDCGEKDPPPVDDTIREEFDRIVEEDRIYGLEETAIQREQTVGRNIARDWIVEKHFTNRRH